jgi:3-oxoacyl-[acyl-carrier protein] reductase
MKTKTYNDYPIIVTGASGTIGKAIIKKLIKSKLNVIALTRYKDKLFEFREKIEIVEVDINDLEIIEVLLKNLLQRHQFFGGLIHCAGYDKIKPMYLNKPKEILDMFKSSVFSAIYLISQLSKKNYLYEGSSIVMLSSMAAHEGAKGHTLYASSKGALEGFLASSAAELVEKKVRINVVILGIVESEMSKNYLDNLSMDKRLEILKSYPLGFGKVSDIAEWIYFLYSNKSKWITGQKIILDGGHSIRSV